MPLTWDTKGIEDAEEVTTIVATEAIPMSGIEAGDRIWNPVTTALVWHSLNTGIGTITVENADEVYARIKLVETLYGASLVSPDGPKPITAEDVLKHVGLKTNARYKPETRASFLKRHAGAFLEDARRHFDKCRPEVAATD